MSEVDIKHESQQSLCNLPVHWTLLPVKHKDTLPSKSPWWTHIKPVKTE